MRESDEGATIGRRRFIEIAAIAGGAAVVGAGGAMLTGQVAAKKRTNVPTWPGRNLMHIPPVIDVSAGPVTLSAAASSVVIGDIEANVWAYNDAMPGPTLVARRGGQATIQVRNELTQPHITHWHGMIVDHDNDGHPRQEVPPGSSYSYAFPIRQRAALNWYHPHSHMLTGEQVAMGLAGGFLVRDDEEDALQLPSGGREIPLVIRDASLDNTNTMQFSTASKGFFGSFPMVNGTRDPYVRVASAVYRFRILGGTNARPWTLRWSNGMAFTLIGTDGGLLPSAVDVTQLTLAPGERADVLVDFRGMARGSRVLLQDLTTGWDLLGAVIGWHISDERALPTTLSQIDDLGQPIRTRTFTFDGMTAINGQTYDINRNDFDVPFGETELWRFSTGGNGPHPVHIHGASFQVVARSGGRNQVFPWERGWKDTVLLDDAETVDILIRFDAYRGEYLIHCHQLGHEDAGMMMNFTVV